MVLWFFWGVLAGLAPGRYSGTTAQGQVWLWLHADHTATFGGVEYRWHVKNETLFLKNETAPLRLVMKTDAQGITTLNGPPFGQVRLTPAPLKTPPVAKPAPSPQQPKALHGYWRHQANGGQLTLALQSDGLFQMVQAVTGDAPIQSHGRWFGDAESFTLRPAAGGHLHYTVRRVGAELWISGGDLPLTVRFQKVEPTASDSL